MLRDENGKEYIPPILAPFHSDIASEKDEKPKNDDYDRHYVPILAPFHDDD